MKKSFPSRSAMLALGTFLMVSAQVLAEDRPADKIIADINAVEMPRVPEDRTDRTAIQEYILKAQKAMEQKSALIGELYKAHPDAPELAKLLPERWQTGMRPGADDEKIKAEIDDVLARSKNEALVTEAAFIKMAIAFQKAGRNGTADDLMPLAEEFIKRAPKDPRGAMILNAVASRTSDVAKKEEISRRIEKDYPDSPIVRLQAGARRQREAIGKPFEIEFNDAIKGAQVNSASLKGKVVVVDFWATWCGPCVAEMPKMKDLYAKYKDKGVEFIGVSLDQPRDDGGYDALKSFVEKNKIEWPQYYEAKVSAKDFATNWGINAIPTVFAVDADGKLFSTEARGKLEDLIPELLEKAEKAKKDEAKP